MSLTEYLELNEKLADEMFSLDQAGKPVYVAAEEQVLQDAVREARGEGVVSLDYLCSVTRSTLYIDETGVSPFSWYAGRLSKANGGLDTPPTIGLLAVLSIAADEMSAGDGMAAHNYYGRLMNLLEVPGNQVQRVQSAYQHIAEDLWASLNDWLVAWEGERGVPTAYALGQRYVGLPMSQALVREHDRGQLTKIFRAEGLAPGFQMTPRDMDDVLTAWVTRVPSPLSIAFRTLWMNTTAREQMLGVACLELEVWDGSGIGDGEHQHAAVRSFGDLRLVATLQTFFGMALELNLSVPLVDGEAVPLTVATVHEDTVLAVARGPVGTGRLADVSSLDLGSLLADEISGTLGTSDRNVSRRPRRVVPLRWHDLQGAYIEVERVERGEKSVLLAVAGLRTKLEELLSMAARPGYVVHDTMRGLPDGWVLVSDVEIMTAASGTFQVDFMPLVPRAQTSLSLNGGLSMPGNLRKWSSQAPPEVYAVATGASRIRVRIDAGSRLGEMVTELEFEGESAIVDLRKLELGDGEYLITLYVEGAKKPASSSLLRLRSGGTPVSEQAIDGTRLVYDSSASTPWPLSAGVRAADNSCIDGVLIDVGFVSKDREDPVSIPTFAPRPRPERTPAPKLLVRVGRQLGEDSCMRSGAHRFILPDAKAGRPESASVQSECDTCGIVKRFPTSPWGAKRKEKKAKKLDVSQLASSLPPVQTVIGDRAGQLFDAVCHVGSGSYSDMTRITSFAEATSLFTDSYLRDLEALGHIDVARDEMLQPGGWGINYPVLVPVDAGHWFLSGRATESMISDLAYATRQGGGILTSRSQGRVHAVEGTGPIDPEKLTEVCEIHGLHVLDRNPAIDLAAVLPSVTSLQPSLARRPIPAAKQIERWDTLSASWVETEQLHKPGAYRLSNFSRIYCLRAEADVAMGTIAVANVQLVKHVASAWAGDPLVGYHDATKSMLVPRGADLPGLYARAAVIASGRIPELKKAGLQYFDISRELADILYTKLAN